MNASPLLLAAPFALCACYGLQSESSYPDYNSSEVRKSLDTPENQPDPSIGLGTFKFKAELCGDMDTRPMMSRLTQEDFARFLEAQGQGRDAVKARSNLYWVEFPGADGGSVKLRLAVLDSAEDAAEDLHRSLLEHGPGWWGIRRSNLAILAPKASLSEAVAFAVRYKLPCWGVFNYASLDDVTVVPGPYAEL